MNLNKPILDARRIKRDNEVLKLLFIAFILHEPN